MCDNLLYIQNKIVFLHDDFCDLSGENMKKYAKVRRSLKTEV